MCHEIKPIKTESDYQEALKEMERLFDAVPGTRGGDRLDVLTTLVEACEEKHFQISSPDPIEAILYYMEAGDSPDTILNAISGAVQEYRRY